MLYAAKCYWSGVDDGDVERLATRAVQTAKSDACDGVAYVGSLLFAADDLVLCTFDGPSRATVKQVSEKVGIPCERVMDSVWLGAQRDDLKGAMPAADRVATRAPPRPLPPHDHVDAR